MAIIRKPKLTSESAKVSATKAAKAKQVLKQHEKQKVADAKAKVKAKQDTAKAKIDQLKEVIKGIEQQRNVLLKAGDKALAVLDKQLDKLHEKQIDMKQKYKLKVDKLENRIATLQTRISEVEIKAGLKSAEPEDYPMDMPEPIAGRPQRKEKKGHPAVEKFAAEIEKNLRKNIKRSRRGLKA